MITLQYAQLALIVFTTFSLTLMIVAIHDHFTKRNNKPASRNNKAILQHAQRFYIHMMRVADSTEYTPQEKRERGSALLQQLLVQLAQYEESSEVHKAIIACTEIHNAVYEDEEIPVESK